MPPKRTAAGVGQKVANCVLLPARHPDHEDLSDSDTSVADGGVGSNTGFGLDPVDGPRHSAGRLGRGLLGARFDAAFGFEPGDDPQQHPSGSDKEPEQVERLGSAPANDPLEPSSNQREQPGRLVPIVLADGADQFTPAVEKCYKQDAVDAVSGGIYQLVLFS